MRKRKANPSLAADEDARHCGLVTEANTTSAPREVTAIAPHPTGSQPTFDVRVQEQRPPAADVASGYSLSPPRIERGRTEPFPETAEGLEVTSETSLPLQEHVLVDQSEEEATHVAGEYVPSRHWFWELLEEAGYDVW